MSQTETRELAYDGRADFEREEVKLGIKHSQRHFRSTVLRDPYSIEPAIIPRLFGPCALLRLLRTETFSPHHRVGRPLASPAASSLFLHSWLFPAQNRQARSVSSSGLKSHWLDQADRSRSNACLDPPLPYPKRSPKLRLQPAAAGFLPRITLKSVADWVKRHRRLIQLGFLALAVINTYFASIVWPQSH